MRTKAAAVGLAVIAVGSLLAGCSSDADVVSHNLSKDAEQFKVNRRIVAINNFTDKYLFMVEGRCSIEFNTATEVICLLENGTYTKHYVQRGDNTTVIAEQTNGTTADTDHYTVIFKPEVIVPNVEVR